MGQEQKRTNKEICDELRLYNKDKGWPLAHEAADRIQELEERLSNLSWQIEANRVV